MTTAPGRTSRWRSRRLLASAVLFLAATAPAVAQNLTPRAYWPAPVGTKVISLGYSLQEGDVVTDPSLPVEGARSSSHALQVGYTQFFRLAGRTASVSFELPWVDASYTGVVEGEPEQRRLEGFADVQARLALNLRGAPAMTPEAFRTFAEDPDPLLGISLEIQSQSGQYDPDRLLNLGSNRWAVKPEIGYIRKIGPGWVAEFALGAWFFTPNDDFQGERREQDPLASGEFHLVRVSPKGIWASLDLNFYRGGRTSVNGEPSDNRQSNSRIGATLVFPLDKRQAIRFAASTSLATEASGHYDAFILAYQNAWR